MLPMARDAKKKSVSVASARKRPEASSASDHIGNSEDNVGGSSEYGRSLEAHEIQSPQHDSQLEEPMALDGIPEAIQQRMYAAAPVLRGRLGAYTKEFFADVVGLCGEGVTLNQVLQTMPVIDEEILAVWKPGKYPCRFEIVNCTDRNLAEKFVEHHLRVYGQRPNNLYFSLRFLRGCYATFVHGKDVDWTAEALLWRNMRIKARTKNPNKLEPVALRQQLIALCRIIASYNAHGELPESRQRPITEAAALEDLRKWEENKTKILRDEAGLLQKLVLAK